MGENDQWSNMLAGTDLIRRVRNAYAMTITLLLNSEGRWVNCKWYGWP